MSCPGLEGTASTAEDGHCVVLVHGTWAPDSEWTKDISPLYAQLIGSLDVDILTFTWSGKNSQRSRYEASIELARFLESSRLARYSGIHLIAHSHGGNIAIRAAYIAERKTSSIITFATPFILGRSRDSSRLDSLIQISVYLLLGPLALIAIYFFPDVVLTPPMRYLGDKLGGLYLVFIFVVFVIACEALAMSLTTLIWKHMWRVRGKYSFFGHATVPTLPIFYNIDEAYVVLRRTFGVYNAINALVHKIDEAVDISTIRRLVTSFDPPLLRLYAVFVPAVLFISLSASSIFGIEKQPIIVGAFFAFAIVLLTTQILLPLVPGIRAE